MIYWAYTSTVRHQDSRMTEALTRGLSLCLNKREWRRIAWEQQWKFLSKHVQDKIATFRVQSRVEGGKSYWNTVTFGCDCTSNSYHEIHLKKKSKEKNQISDEAMSRVPLLLFWRDNSDLPLWMRVLSFCFIAIRKCYKRSIHLPFWLCISPCGNGWQNTKSDQNAGGRHSAKTERERFYLDLSCSKKLVPTTPLPERIRLSRRVGALRHASPDLLLQLSVKQWFWFSNDCRWSASRTDRFRIGSC